MGQVRAAGDKTLANSKWPLKVFVMSHHLVVRAGLTMFICPEGDLDLVGESGVDASALPLLQACTPDVVILDLDGEGAPDLFAAIAHAVPAARVLLLTAARNAPRHHALLCKGVVGLLLKEAPVHVVLKELRRCHRTDAEILAPTASGGSLVLPQEPDLHHRRIAGLTGRDRELVDLIGEGLRNDQIAGRLGLSEKNVRNRLSCLFYKLGVNDRLGLAVYAFEHGLRPPPA